jgi:hypothetical protein
MIDYADGSTYRLSTLARAQAAQLALDGQTFGFGLVAYYIETKGDMWIATRAIVLYRQGKRLSVVEPVKQDTVGWAVHSSSSAGHCDVRLVVQDVVSALPCPTSMDFASDVDPPIRESHFFANLGIDVPTRRYKVRRDELGANVAFAERFFIHAARGRL